MEPYSRRERDSNPRYQKYPIRRFSKPVPSATRPSLQVGRFVRPGLPVRKLERVGTRRQIEIDPRARPAHDHLHDTIRLSRPAEEEGFEPPELALGGFQDRCLRPLGHSSSSELKVSGV